ncbi:hypothetical protein MNB_SV-4-374 [hydrothermal vent metagenome]|uniref:Uncharacterized protein n=1 Tax=hydrothermal vent metagenome TaxID=652676 RepID=A0A1W1E8T6_9ZZZZ
MQFKQISANNSPIQDVILAAFDTRIDVAGGWGYTQKEATVLTDNPQLLPLEQLEHMLVSMRTYLEMNMTLPKEARYGSININEKTRELYSENNKTYHKVTYKISAMKESDYATFIEEYKEGYGKASFDVEAHFRRRKEATLIRIMPYWFNVSQIN